MKPGKIQTMVKAACMVMIMMLIGKYSSAQANKAYGDNMVKIDSVLVGGNYQPVFAIYSGDINQDGNIDLSDFPMWDADNSNFASGYLVTDLNGDGNVDLSDFPIWDVNNSNFVSTARPF